MLKFRKADPLFKIAICYFSLIFLTEVLTSTLSLVDISNANVSNIFYLFEGVILIFFILKMNSQRKFVFYISILIYSAIWLIYNYEIGKLNVYNSDFRTLECILIQLLSGFTLYKQGLKTSIPIFINHHIIFLFGIFLYFGANIILFYLTNILIDIDKEYAINMWAIHSIINMITIAIFTYSIYFIIPKANHD